MIDRPEEYQKMDLVEEKLWWYKVLHEQTLAAIQKKHPTKNIAILDAACGTGGLIKYLQSQGFTDITGFDVSPQAVERSRKKTNQDIQVLDLREVLTRYPTNTFDVIVCNDALYFLSANEFPNVLNQLLSMLKSDGQLILNLPAGNGFKGMHDHSVGIKERWSIKKFEQLLTSSDLTSTKIDYLYWPFLLFPFILATRLTQRFRLFLFPSAVIQSDVSMPPFVLNEIFYKLTKWESRLPFNIKLGSSLFITVQRQTHETS
jgi:SAM-dependent methyltransferase